MPTAYKLFTNIIKNRLNEHVEEMVEEQSGFRTVVVPMQQIIEKKKRTQLTTISFIYRL